MFTFTCFKIRLSRFLIVIVMCKNMQRIRILLLLFLLKVIAGRELTDAEYYRLPDLYHLDNYDQCLSDEEGVYCLGTFYVTPMVEPNPVYELMKEYSEETYTFNRTLIHRGYCISSRCPDNTTSLSSLNSTSIILHFSRCTAHEVKQYALKTSLTALKYCRTRADVQMVVMPSVPQILFLSVVLVLLVMNVIGTIYDVRTRDNPKRMRILMACSCIGNWKLLTKYEDKGQSALTALHGIRVCVAISVCLSHSALLYFSLYLYQPRVLEHVAAHPLAMLVQNSTGLEQMFVVISGFLYAFQLRVYLEKQQLSFRLLPVLIAKRIIRLSPVFLLVVGFAATWWPLLGSGPIWSATVGAESHICKEKFWAHLLFINNLVQADKQCVLPTWYMAVDVQMHVFSTVVLLFLSRHPHCVLRALGVLFAASCLINAGLVYWFDWTPMLYLTVSPENLRTLFRDVPSFAQLYISPWGNVSVCLLGLILGYVYYDMKDEDFALGKYKWVVNISCLASIPVLATWLLLGYFLQHVKAKAFMVVYAAMERSVFQILVLLTYVIFSVISGFVIKFLAWRGWHALSRMSLSVMMLHWIVNLYLVGATPQPMSTSILDIAIYGISTAVYTFVIAVPITILVEMPMKKFFDVITA